MIILDEEKIRRYDILMRVLKICLPDEIEDSVIEDKDLIKDIKEVRGYLDE